MPRPAPQVLPIFAGRGKTCFFAGRGSPFFAGRGGAGRPSLHRIHSRKVTGLGLSCNVDTGIHQVSDVLGLDLLLRELFPLKVDRASNRQLGNGTDQLGDFGGNEWGRC